MARDHHIYYCIKLLVVCALLTAARGTADRTKTLDFDVKPGGVVHTFSAKMKKYECTFTYASQGGTNEQWQMSVGLSDDNKLFSCSVWRPQGKSYLFFTQFKAEIKGAKIEFATAFSQTAVGGQRDVPLKEEEYIVSESTVTHRDGKFVRALKAHCHWSGHATMNSDWLILEGCPIAQGHWSFDSY